MSARRPGDFYVGYEPRAPAAAARGVRRAMAGVFAVVLALGVSLPLAQEPFASAVFEFGVTRAVDGTITERPVPSLVAASRAGAGSDPSRYLLVGPGKHGAEDRVAGLHGARVTVNGSLIYRHADTMIEVHDLSAAPAGVGAGLEDVPRVEAYGPVTLAGEIVDSKCHLGVMNPGDGKPHRACAARCVSGGVPPALAIRGPAGERQLVFLVGEDGRAINREVLEYVAEPLEVTGALERAGDLWVLRTGPSAFRRLS